MFQNLRNRLIKYKIIHNYKFRTFLFSTFSLIFGIAYCIFNIVIASIYHSIWYGSLTCYYAMLIMLRVGVLSNGYKSSKQDNEEVIKIKKIKRYRLCGILFLLMTIFLGVIIIQLVRSDKTYQYPLFVLIVVSCYTISRVIIAIYNVKKASNHDDFNVKSLRNINFVTAVVSCLSLQSAFLYVMYTGKYVNEINMTTGIFVCIILLVMGIFMIIKSTIILNYKEKSKFDK